MTKISKGEPNEYDKANHLYLIDDLIKRMYHALLGKIDEITKTGDFIKMVELRRKLTPEKQSEKELWKLLERVRRDVLGGNSHKKRSNSIASESTKMKQEKKEKKEKKGKRPLGIMSSRNNMAN